MDELFSHYERELGMLRRLCGEFAARYPERAAQLQIGSEVCADPQIERLVQSAALVNAHLAQRLDDAYPQFTEALLERDFPHFLRPFPSCAIVQFSPAQRGGNTNGEIGRIARGTVLQSASHDKAPCTFRTTRHLTLAPIAIDAARYNPILQAPIGTRLPVDAASSISIDVRSTAAKPLAALKVNTIEVFIDAAPNLGAALLDAIHQHGLRAYLQAQGQEWQALASSPIVLSGLDADEALLPGNTAASRPYQLLSEYFAFPEQFNFFAIDLDACVARLPPDSTGFTLHLVLPDTDLHEDRARRLASLRADNLLLGCTPVINLFEQAGVPTSEQLQCSDFTLLPHATRASDFEIYSVDKVWTQKQSGKHLACTAFAPFYSGQRGCPDNGHFWELRHDAVTAVSDPGHEKTIRLTDAACEPLLVDRTTLAIALTCSNRDLPSQLERGGAKGDLFQKNPSGASVCHFVRMPGRRRCMASHRQAHWDLISCLAQRWHRSTQDGIDNLRCLLSLCDFRHTTETQALIAGLVALEHQATAAWFKRAPGPELVDGVEVRIRVDARAFAACSMQVVSHLVSLVFALSVPSNSFVELVILAHDTGKVLLRCAPREGGQSLL